MADDRRGPPRSGRRDHKPVREVRAFDVWLNRQLHAMYDDIAHEPLPAATVELIEQDSVGDAPVQADAAGATPAKPDKGGV